MTKAPIIGIDLGTTNCCAAIVHEEKDGNPQVKLIPYKAGEYTIPSIVAVDERGNELLGLDAKRQWQLNPRHTIFASKRLLGRRFNNPVVETMRQSVAYGIRAGQNNEVLVLAGNKTYSLPEISSRILQKVREVAQSHLQWPVERAVVTVPAYFNDRERQAVKDAGKMIGLEVVRIINEPTAAALAYGVSRRSHQKIVVYDLGGGTFDVSIIEIRDRVFEVKATGGDIFLGGIDFDNAIIQFVLRDFHNRTGIELKDDPVAMQRIKDLAEKTKIDLSSREEAPFHIPFVTVDAHGQPKNIELLFTRKLLEQLTSKLIERSMKTVAQVLVDSGFSSREINDVVLVGGQSRMPAIQEKLSKFFDRLPSKSVHPDEAVAIGAALYAHSLQDDTNLRIQLLDVIPMAIGIEKAGGAFHVVFPRNAPIPNAKQFVATTSYDGQTDIALRIFQGDSPHVSANELLGEFNFSGVPPAPAGSAQIEVTFQVNVEGILTLHAHDPKTGREMKTTLRVTQS